MTGAHLKELMRTGFLDLSFSPAYMVLVLDCFIGSYFSPLAIPNVYTCILRVIFPMLYHSSVVCHKGQYLVLNCFLLYMTFNSDCLEKSIGVKIFGDDTKKYFFLFFDVAIAVLILTHIAYLHFVHGHNKKFVPGLKLLFLVFACACKHAPDVIKVKAVRKRFTL